MQRSAVLSLAVSASLAVARAEPPPASADVGHLEDVVVTAQRREETAQSVGIALTVLSDEILKDVGVTRVNDLQNATPSLEIEPAFGSGQAQFRLRGVGFIDYTANNSSPVAVNIDGVALPFPIQTQGQIYDVNRVEVLRGPQGTLYGRNTTGGAVNFITNRPTSDYQSGFDVSYGSHDAFSGEGYLSGPIGEGFRARLAVATEQGGAWQRNRLTNDKLGNKDKVAGRLQLEWDPASIVNLRLTLHASQDKSDAYGLQLIAPFQPASPGAPLIPADTSPYATGWSLGAGFAQAIGIAPGSKPGFDNSNLGANLDINVDLGRTKFTSVLAYTTLIRRELGDWDASQYEESDEYFHDHVKVFSYEAHLASSTTDPLAWVTGLYYSNEKLHESFYGDFSQRLGGAADTDYEQDGDTLGVFGQTDYKFSDTLKGVLGLRFEHEELKLKHLVTLFSVANPPVFDQSAFALQGATPLDRSLTNNDVSGKLGLEYSFSPRQMLYASISRGVKSGGFTAHNTLNQAAVDPFQPEKLTAYEVGMKADLSAQLRLNAALFHYDYRDQQVLSKVFDTVSQSYIGRFVNAPSSRIDGGEIELTWRPLESLEISQYAGYKTGKFTGDVFAVESGLPPAPASYQITFNGRDIDFPKTSYGGEIAWTVPIAGFRLRSEINYSYHDVYDQPFLLEHLDYPDGNISGAKQFQVNSYWLANGSISLLPESGEDWLVGLWVRNLTDQKYFLTKNFFLPNTNVGQAGEPTTFGVRVAMKFR